MQPHSRESHFYSIYILVSCSHSFLASDAAEVCRCACELMRGSPPISSRRSPLGAEVDRIVELAALVTADTIDISTMSQLKQLEVLFLYMLCACLMFSYAIFDFRICVYVLHFVFFVFVILNYVICMFVVRC